MFSGTVLYFPLTAFANEKGLCLILFVWHDHNIYEGTNYHRQGKVDKCHGPSGKEDPRHKAIFERDEEQWFADVC